MKCTLPEIKDGHSMKIEEAVLKGLERSAEIKGGFFVLPFSADRKKINSEAKAYQIAKKQIEKIRSWEKETYGSYINVVPPGTIPSYSPQLKGMAFPFSRMPYDLRIRLEEEYVAEVQYEEEMEEQRLMNEYFKELEIEKNHFEYGQPFYSEEYGMWIDSNNPLYDQEFENGDVLYNPFDGNNQDNFSVDNSSEENFLVYDEEGFDQFGYDREGFDRDGLDINGERREESKSTERSLNRLEYLEEAKKEGQKSYQAALEFLKSNPKVDPKISASSLENLDSTTANSSPEPDFNPDSSTDNIDFSAEPQTSPELYHPEEVGISSFTPYIEYKKKLLKNLRNSLKAYTIQNRNFKGTAEYKNMLRSFYQSIEALEKELETLKTDKGEDVINMMIEEAKNLTEQIKSKDLSIYSVNEVSDRLDFLFLMLNGQSREGKLSSDAQGNFLVENPLYGRYEQSWDYRENFPEAFEELLKQINEASVEYNKALKDIVVKMSMENPIFQTNMEMYYEDEANGVEENKRRGYSEKQLLELIESGGADLNVLSQQFQGISDSDETSIVPHLMKAMLTSKLQEIKGNITELKNIAEEYNKRLMDKNFDMSLFYNPEDYGETLINYTTEAFEKHRRKQLHHIYNVKTSKGEVRKEAYKNRMHYYDKIADVIDFTKLKRFKETFGKNGYEKYFDHSEDDMQTYEDELRERLGPLFDSLIEEYMHKIEDYIMFEETLDANDKYREMKIARNSPFVFIKNLPQFLDGYKNNTSMTYTYDEANNYKVYNISEYVMDIPKEKDSNGKPTNFYNESFKEILKDEDAFMYWETLKELYQNHINPTYQANGQDVKNLSVAQIRKTFLEQLKDLSFGDISTYKFIINELKDFLQSMVYYNSIHKKDFEGVTPEYRNTAKKEVTSLKNLLSLKPLEDLMREAHNRGVDLSHLPTLAEATKGLEINSDIYKKAKISYKNGIAEAIAREQVMSKYSTDIHKTTMALANMAALQQARQESLSTSKMLIDYEKKVNPHRKNAIKKYESFRSSVIQNNPMANTEVGKDGKVVKQNLFGKSISNMKKMSDIDKDIMKLMEEITKNGVAEDSEYSFNLDTGTEYKYDGKQFLKNEKAISKKEFEEALGRHFREKALGIGTPLTVGSFLYFFRNARILAGLTFSPVSGLFNREEGLHQNITRGAMGDYYSSRDLTIAERFMRFHNVSRINGKVGRTLKGKKYFEQFQTHQLLLNQLAVLQDRKEELQRQQASSKFIRTLTNYFNPYALSVDNPEYKNQNGIILSLLANLEVKDINGDSHKFFDFLSVQNPDGTFKKDNSGNIVKGQNIGFNIYIPGTLTLRPEFRTEENIQNFEKFKIDKNSKINTFMATKAKISQSINMVQGNYDPLDNIMITDNEIGKTIMLFKRWLPTHVASNYSTRQNLNPLTGLRKMQAKKPLSMAFKWPIVFGGYTSAALGLTYGASVAIPTFGFLAIAPFLGKVVYQKLKKEEVFVMKEFKILLGLFQESFARFADTPFRWVSSLMIPSESKLYQDHSIFNRALEKKTIDEDSLRSLRSLAMDLSAHASYIATIIGLKMLIMPDEEDESWYAEVRRLFLNFVDNFGTRMGDSIMSWSNPANLYRDTTQIPIYTAFSNINKALDQYSKGKKSGMETGVKIAEQFIPMSNTMRNIAKYNTTGGEQGSLPFLDNKEYSNNQWHDRLFKDYHTDGEYSAKKDTEIFKYNLKQVLAENLEHYLEERGIDTETVTEEHGSVKKINNIFNQSGMKKRKGESDKAYKERIIKSLEKRFKDNPEVLDLLENYKDGDLEKLGKHKFFEEK